MLIKKARLGDRAKPPMINGNDLLEAGFKADKQLKKVLAEAYDLQLQGIDRERILRSLKKKYDKG